MIAPARLVVFALPLLVAAVPLVLRPTAAPPAPEAVQLVVVTPHNSMTSDEFGHAFQVWARRELKVEVAFDWRRPGGTGDIVRYFDSRFRDEFADQIRAKDASLADQSSRIADAALDASTKPEDAVAKQARAAFLASEVSIGIDVWWGGGEFDHRKQAEKGYLIDAGLLQSEPEWFGDGKPIPPMLSGEVMYDSKGRYYGACLSTFGICANVDRLAHLGRPEPKQWDDLADPAYLGHAIIVDPTRSGAALTCLERIVQQAMARGIARGLDEPAALAAGWKDGLNLIKRIAANASMISDGASQGVRAVAQGNVAVGMAIDFHGRSEIEWSTGASGVPRLTYGTPAGGSSYGADPIALLRGAGRHGKDDTAAQVARGRQVAIAFMRFVLSPEGQRLWNHRAGTPAGPVRYNLRRLPIRRDVFTEADRRQMTDGGIDPFVEALAFTYHPQWTGRHRNLISQLTRAMMIDPQDELIAAWRAIHAAGGPARVPEAMREFDWVPVTYGQATEVNASLTRNAKGERVRDADRLAILRGWTVAAQEHYRAAMRLAEAGR